MSQKTLNMSQKTLNMSQIMSQKGSFGLHWGVRMGFYPLLGLLVASAIYTLVFMGQGPMSHMSQKSQNVDIPSQPQPHQFLKEEFSNYKEGTNSQRRQLEGGREEDENMFEDVGDTPNTPNTSAPAPAPIIPLIPLTDVSIGIVTMLNNTDVLFEWIEHHIDQGVTEFYLCIDLLINRPTSESLLEQFSLYEEFYRKHHPHVHLYFYQSSQFELFPSTGLDQNLSTKRMKDTHNLYQMVSVAAMSRSGTSHVNMVPGQQGKHGRQDLSSRPDLSSPGSGSDHSWPSDMTFGYMIELLKALPTFILWIDSDEFVGSQKYTHLIDYLTAVPVVDDHVGQQYRSGTLSEVTTFMKAYGLGDADVLTTRVWLSRDTNGEVVVNYIPHVPYHNPEVVFESAFVTPDQSGIGASDGPLEWVRGPFHSTEDLKGEVYVDPRTLDTPKGRLLRLEGLTREMMDPLVYLDVNKQRGIFERAVDLLNSKIVGGLNDNHEGLPVDFPFLINRKRYTALQADAHARSIEPMSAMNFLRTMYAIAPECIYGAGQHLPIKYLNDRARGKYDGYYKDAVSGLNHAERLPSPSLETLLELSQRADHSRGEMQLLKSYIDSVPPGERGETWKDLMILYHDMLLFQSDVAVFPLGRKSRVGSPFSPRLFNSEQWKKSAKQRHIFSLTGVFKEEYNRTLVDEEMFATYCLGVAPTIYQLDKTMTFTPFYYQRLEELGQGLYEYLQSGIEGFRATESVSKDFSDPINDDDDDDEAADYHQSILSAREYLDPPTHTPHTHKTVKSLPIGLFDRISAHFCNDVEIHYCHFGPLSGGSSSWSNNLFIEHKALPSLEARFDHTYREGRKVDEPTGNANTTQISRQPGRDPRANWKYMDTLSCYSDTLVHIHDTMVDYRRLNEDYTPWDTEGGSSETTPTNRSYKSIFNIISEADWFKQNPDSYHSRIRDYKMISSQTLPSYQNYINSSLNMAPLPIDLKPELEEEAPETHFTFSLTPPSKVSKVTKNLSDLSDPHSEVPNGKNTPFFGVVGEGERLTYPFDQIYYDQRARPCDRHYDPRTVLQSSLWDDSLLGMRFDEDLKKWRESSTTGSSSREDKERSSDSSNFVERILSKYKVKRSGKRVKILDDDESGMGFRIVFEDSDWL